jgi:hypothetical protein
MGVWTSRFGGDFESGSDCTPISTGRGGAGGWELVCQPETIQGAKEHEEKAKLTSANWGEKNAGSDAMLVGYGSSRGSARKDRESAGGDFPDSRVKSTVSASERACNRGAGGARAEAGTPARNSAGTSPTLEPGTQSPFDRTEERRAPVANASCETGFLGPHSRAGVLSELAWFRKPRATSERQQMRQAGSSSSPVMLRLGNSWFSRAICRTSGARAMVPRRHLWLHHLSHRR